MKEVKCLSRLVNHRRITFGMIKMANPIDTIKVILLHMVHKDRLIVILRDIYSPKVLVIPRNRWLRLNMTEKLFTGTLNHNQNKKQKQ